MRRWVHGCAVVVALAVVALPARADEVDAARQAYDRGAAAFDAGDYARAVAELSRADELAPNAIALDLALKAATKSDDALALVDLADRADRRGVLASAALAARAKAAGRTGRISASCADAGTCRASIDGALANTRAAVVVLVGVHKVVLEDRTGREERVVEVGPDATLEIEKKASVAPTVEPERITPSPTPERSGLSPIWFWTGVGVTAVLGGVATVSAFDTKKKHDEFASTPTDDLRNAGLDSQLRTNLLAGGALVAAVATTALALVFVDWNGGARSGSRAAR